MDNFDAIIEEEDGAQLIGDNIESNSNKSLLIRDNIESSSNNPGMEGPVEGQENREEEVQLAQSTAKAEAANNPILEKNQDMATKL